MSEKQYDNEMKGILFINTDRKKDTHPNWRGSLQINGVEYWVSGWDRNTKKGDAITLAVEVKKSAASAYDAKPKQADKFIDDDIPFN